MSRPVKRSFSIKGHRTSISLEPPFWQELKAIADSRDTSLAALVAQIDASRTDAGDDLGLSTAVRLFILADLKSRLASRTQ